MLKTDLHAFADADVYKTYPHAPPHLFRPGAAYFITAKTHSGAPMLATTARRAELIDSLAFAAAQHRWQVVAWVVLSNHYHCILQAPAQDPSALSTLLNSVHKFTSRRWNQEDSAPGRRVWYQYWDTCLTSEGSFWARLNYIHYNPVRHGLAQTPQEYAFSSYRVWQARADFTLAEVEDAYPWDRLELE
jgi:putative transposase